MFILALYLVDKKIRTQIAFTFKRNVSSEQDSYDICKLTDICNLTKILNGADSG